MDSFSGIRKITVLSCLVVMISAWIASPAQAQYLPDGSYIQLDTASRKYGWEPHHLIQWSGGTSRGILSIYWLELAGGIPKFCIEAYHFGSDYGLQLFKEYAAGVLMPSRQVSFSSMDTASMNPIWQQIQGREIHMRLPSGDTLRMRYQTQGDTVSLDFWWLHALDNHDRFLPGNIDSANAELLVRGWLRDNGLTSGYTSSAPVIVQYMVKRFVKETPVGVRRGAKTYRPFWTLPWRLPHDLLGRARK